MAEQPDPAPRHVLLVDDEHEFLDELTLYLRRRGWTVTATHAPQEALAQLGMHADIAVVVTDVRMASLDGFQLARRIQREHAGSRAVTVVVVTGHGALMIKNDTEVPPDLPILRKPLVMSGFLATLDAALGRSRAARAAAYACPARR